MRYYPAGIGLAIVLALTSSVTHANKTDYVPDARSEALIAEGAEAERNGDLMLAIDLYEAALAVDPANADAYLALAHAARAQGLQGKAISYYREVLTMTPDSLGALSGEGEALVERGALEKARRNLAKLQDLCGKRCPETRRLAAALDKGPPAKVLSAEAVTPQPVVEQP